MEDVNKNINFKQYIIIPFLGLALVMVGWYIGSTKSQHFENDFVSFDLEGDWFNSSVEGKEATFSIVESHLAKVQIKELESYTNSGLGSLFGDSEFGIEEGHNLYNDALYDDYRAVDTKEIKVKGNDDEGIYFDIEFNDSVSYTHLTLPTTSRV